MEQDVGFDGFEWDESKRECNLAKHGIDFEDATLIFDGIVVEADDLRRDYGERRVIALGVVDGLLLYVVWTPRESNRRIISGRLAKEAERQAYYDFRQKKIDRRR